MSRSFSKIRHIQEANKKLEKRLLKETYEVDESFWDNIFGKADVKDAAHSALKAKGYSHTGKDEDKQYTMFDGIKFYEDDIEYADPYDTGDIPRIEDGKLIIANPAWSL
jgi:hypothetical protein